MSLSVLCQVLEADDVLLLEGLTPDTVLSFFFLEGLVADAVLSFFIVGII